MAITHWSRPGIYRASIFGPMGTNGGTPSEVHMSAAGLGVQPDSEFDWETIGMSR